MKLGVLVVTFNRLDKLKKLLSIYDGDKAIDKLVIVDNHSTDGTKKYLDEINLDIKSIKIFNLDKNTGGSGGFYHGLNYMKDLDLDWIYLSDDDAYPEELVFSTFKKRAENVDSKKISAICTSVINHGEYHLDHRMVTNKKVGFAIIKMWSKIKDYDKDEFELALYSFVGVFINNNKLTKNTLPEKDFFIWFDDIEHSMQFSKTGKLICWPSLRVHHDQDEGMEKISWKSYYHMRNKLFTYKKYYGNGVFNFYYFKCYIKALFNKNKNISKMFLAAMESAKKGTLGIHELYKPGWKLK